MKISRYLLQECVGGSKKHEENVVLNSWINALFCKYRKIFMIQQYIKPCIKSNCPVLVELNEAKVAPRKSVPALIATAKAIYGMVMSINRAYTKKLECSKFTLTVFYQLIFQL